MIGFIYCRSVMTILMAVTLVACERRSNSAAPVAATNNSSTQSIAAPSLPLTLTRVSGKKRPAFLNSSWGPVLWMTNHTTNTLVTHLTLETNQGGIWIPSRPYSAIFHTTTNKIEEGKAWFPTSQQPFLAGHQAAHVTFGHREMPMLPDGAVWRVKAQIGVQLTGVSEMMQWAKMYPDTVQRRLRSGDTNISLDPFPNNASLFLPLTEFTSEEFSEK